MNKITKIFALYAIISGIAMVVMWGIFYAIGFAADKMSHAPIAFWVLMAAEGITAMALVAGGFGIIRRKNWGRNLTFISMGMLLYAVIFASGEFAQQKNVCLTCLFILLFCATSIVLLANLFRNET
jgi:hypothetical protein